MMDIFSLEERRRSEMKNILMIVVFVVVSLFIVSISEAGETEIFGLVLGKPIPKDTKIEVEDYTFGNIKCFTKLPNPLSFPVKIYIVLENDCDRTTNIKEIQVNFSSSDFGKVEKLALGKWGTPSSSKETELQNKMGAKFTKVTMIWNMDSDMIYLTSITRRVDEAILILTYRTYAAEEWKRIKDSEQSDKSKF